MAHLMITATSKTGRQAMPGMLTARTRAARRLPQPRKRFEVLGLNDQFTLELNLDVKFLSADVRFQVQNRVSTRQKKMHHPPSNSTKTKVMQVT